MARSGQKRTGCATALPARSTEQTQLEASVGRALTPEEVAAVERYREVRDAEIAKGAASDVAFRRYFTKLQAGEPTNGAAVSRLENEANELSSKRWSAEHSLYQLDIDPDVIDKADGIVPLYRG